MRVTGHNVLVTGGSVGIGFALARAFHKRANQVTISARRAQALAEASQRLPGVHTVIADMTSEDDLRHLVGRAADLMGGISILVNNAGIQRNDTFGHTDAASMLEHIDGEIATNFTGLVKLTALAIPHLQGAENGAVVNVSSVLALAPKRSAPVYCATKAAVHSFTMALRYQLEGTAPHVRVFEVLPPGVDTAMTAGRDFKKMAPDELAADVIDAMDRDRLELHAGMARQFAWLHRLSPKAAYRAMKNR